MYDKWNLARILLNQLDLDQTPIVDSIDLASLYSQFLDDFLNHEWLSDAYLKSVKDRGLEHFVDLVYPHYITTEDKKQFLKDAFDPSFIGWT